TNPIGVLVLLLRGIKWVAVRTPAAVSLAFPAIVSGIGNAGYTLAMFVAGVFIHVHSERRTLCFVDATLGAALGYSFGSAIIGAVAGAVLGVVNYELISVRWLKLASASN
ncbi:MAG: hypothetical protein ACREF8_05285, partial [Chthoniobacterales bacterium]